MFTLTVHYLRLCKDLSEIFLSFFPQSMVFSPGSTAASSTSMPRRCPFLLLHPRAGDGGGTAAFRRLCPWQEPLEAEPGPAQAGDRQSLGGDGPWRAVKASCDGAGPHLPRQEHINHPDSPNQAEELGGGWRAPAPAPAPPTRPRRGKKIMPEMTPDGKSTNYL